MQNKSVFIFILERKYLRRQSEYKEVGTNKAFTLFLLITDGLQDFIYILYTEK